jgi:hypothetical protein
MKKFIVTVLTLIALAVLGFVLVGDCITTGERLRGLSEEYGQYIEYTFYGLVIIITYFLVLRPIFIVLFSPYYSLRNYVDEKSTMRHAYAKIKVLIKRKVITDPEEIQEYATLYKLKEYEKLSKRLYIIYQKEVKEQIEKIIVESSRNTLVLTGVSQNKFLDSLSVLVCNIQMIKKIVALCGFRPTFLRVMKLYLRVFVASLIANGLSQVDVAGMISTSIKGLGKVLTNSAVDGAVNALFVLRIGILTRNYIYAETVDKDKLSISSFTETVALFPSVLSLLVTSPLKSVINLFKPEVKEKDLEEPEIKAVWGKKQ